MIVGLLDCGSIAAKCLQSIFPSLLSLGKDGTFFPKKENILRSCQPNPQREHFSVEIPGTSLLAMKAISGKKKTSRHRQYFICKVQLSSLFKDVRLTVSFNALFMLLKRNTHRYTQETPTTTRCCKAVQRQKLEL